MSKYNSNNSKNDRSSDFGLILFCMMALGIVICKKDKWPKPVTTQMEYVNNDGRLNSPKKAEFDSLVQLRNDYDKLIQIENSKKPASDSVLQKLISQRHQIVYEMNKFKRLK